MAGERRPNVIGDERCTFCTSPVRRGKEVIIGGSGAKIQPVLWHLPNQRKRGR